MGSGSRIGVLLKYFGQLKLCVKAKLVRALSKSPSCKRSAVNALRKSLLHKKCIQYTFCVKRISLCEISVLKIK